MKHIMKLFAVLIGFLGVQCVLSAQCQKPVKNSTDDCMMILHPLHKLLGDVFNVPAQRVKEVISLLKNLLAEIGTSGHSSATRGRCLNVAVHRVDVLSKSYMEKIINVDRSIKQRFIGVYMALENAFGGAQECVNKPDSSCKEIQECCTNVRNKLYANKNVDVEEISNFITEFSLKFGKEYDSILNSIHSLQRNVRTC